LATFIEKVVELSKNLVERDRKVFVWMLSLKQEAFYPKMIAHTTGFKIIDKIPQRIIHL